MTLHPDIAAVLEGKARWAIIHSDCREVLPTLADKAVAHVITDPPYSEHTHSKQWSAAAIGRPTKHTGIDFDPLAPELAAEVASQAARAAARWVLAFTDLEGLPLWRESMSAAGLEVVRACIWVKPDATPQFTGDRPAAGAEAFLLAHSAGRKHWNGGGKRNVYTHTREAGGSDHPTMKPLALMLELVADFTDADEVVLDPFAGSGTTGVACLRLGRRFIGIEKDAKYAAVARERLEAETQGLTLRDARAGQQPLFPVQP